MPANLDDRVRHYLKDVLLRIQDGDFKHHQLPGAVENIKKYAPGIPIDVVRSNVNTAIVTPSCVYVISERVISPRGRSLSLSVGLSIEQACAAVSREIRKYLTTSQPLDPVNTDAIKYQASVDLWNAGGKTWSEITSETGEPAEDWKSFSQSVKRYAAKNSLPLRKGKPGVRRKRDKRNK